jgi:hypothetical protein
MYLPKTEFGQQITQTKINNNNIDLPKSCFIQCTQIMITSIPCNPKHPHPLRVHAHIHTHLKLWLYWCQAMHHLQQWDVAAIIQYCHWFIILWVKGSCVIVTDVFLWNILYIDVHTSTLKNVFENKIFFL